MLLVNLHCQVGKGLIESYAARYGIVVAQLHSMTGLLRCLEVQVNSKCGVIRQMYWAVLFNVSYTSRRKRGCVPCTMNMIVPQVTTHRVGQIWSWALVQRFHVSCNAFYAYDDGDDYCYVNDTSACLWTYQQISIAFIAITTTTMTMKSFRTMTLSFLHP